MVVVSTREFRDKQKKYFELAEKERVIVKRGKKYINFFVSEEIENNFVNESWIKEFFSIPEEFRCNPFEMSPSGDLFWADRRHVESVKKHIEIAEQQMREGKVTICKTIEENHKHLDSL